jgi:hypothetical protein
MKNLIKLFLIVFATILFSCKKVNTTAKNVIIDSSLVGEWIWICSVSYGNPPSPTIATSVPGDSDLLTFNLDGTYTHTYAGHISGIPDAGTYTTANGSNGIYNNDSILYHHGASLVPPIGSNYYLITNDTLTFSDGLIGKPFNGSVQYLKIF